MLDAPEEPLWAHGVNIKFFSLENYYDPHSI